MSSRPLASKNYLAHVVRTTHNKIDELTEIYLNVVRANEVKWWTPQFFIESKKLGRLRTDDKIAKITLENVLRKPIMKRTEITKLT